MSSPLGFQTPEDRRVEAAQLNEIYEEINDAVTHVLAEFVAASWVPNAFLVRRHPGEIGWYLAGADTGPLQSPVVITLAFSDSDDGRIPTLLVEASEDVDQVPFNVRALPRILNQQTGIRVRLDPAWRDD